MRSLLNILVRSLMSFMQLKKLKKQCADEKLTCIMDPVSVFQDVYDEGEGGGGAPARHSPHTPKINTKQNGTQKNKSKKIKDPKNKSFL